MEKDSGFEFRPPEASELASLYCTLTQAVEAMREAWLTRRRGDPLNLGQAQLVSAARTFHFTTLHVAMPKGRELL